MGWIGVDLDGTLCESKPDGTGYHPPGRPIEPMVRRVFRWVEQGKDVRIFTGRDESQWPEVREWLRVNGLPNLPVTNKKDADLEEIWDDRAHRVCRNDGSHGCVYGDCGVE